MKINKIGIVGLGLIGGSLAKAAKANFKNLQIIASDSDKAALSQAFEEKIIDSYSTEIDEEFSGCDMVFACVPARLIPETVNKLNKFVSPGCLITDVGSTKYNITEKIPKGGAAFIGAHPMAGSEKSGYGASKEFLFENAYYIMTPFENTAEDKISMLQGFIEGIGAIPVSLEPKEHDYAVGAISHVPHVLASALVNMVRKLDEKGLYKSLAAGGFKDITRIASSNPGMWAGISLENKESILELLNILEDEIKDYKVHLQSEDYSKMESFFEKAKVYRDSLASPVRPFDKNYEIKVDVKDKPGMIATVSTLLSVNSINIKNIGIMNSREYESGIMSVHLSTENDMARAFDLLVERNFSVYKNKE